MLLYVQSTPLRFLTDDLTVQAIDTGNINQVSRITDGIRSVIVTRVPNKAAGLPTPAL